VRRSANATAQAQSPIGVMRRCRLRTAHVVSTMSVANVRLTKRADAPQVCERAGLRSKRAGSEPERHRAYEWHGTSTRAHAVRGRKPLYPCAPMECHEWWLRSEDLATALSPFLLLREKIASEASMKKP
jgi:hypothetical protein